MMKKTLLIIIYIFIFQTILSSQSRDLAANYFQNGEFEKAAMIYKKLYRQNNSNEWYFKYYIKSLVYDENYKEAINAINSYLKRKPQNLYLLVDLGYIYEIQGDIKKAEKYYTKAIDNITNNSNQVIDIGNAFRNNSNYDLALQTYEKGLEIVDDKKLMLKYIGDIYVLKKNQGKMVYYYLEYLTYSVKKTNIYNIKNTFSKNLSKEYIDTLKVNLITKIQENPNNAEFIDLLSWVYLYEGNYEKAIRQIIAIDRRFNENGARVFNFAVDAAKAKKYKTAAKAYKYIIQNKERNTPYLMRSIREYLEITSEILVNDTTTTRDDFLEIEEQYNDFINKFGTNNQTATLIIELAKLEAMNLNKLDKGIKILKDLINLSYIDRQYIAQAKIKLGDLYLIKGEIWESSLLYSQVDKEFTEGRLGELARYKNAKLYYYNGDFEWAQIIFDILKPATSRMISNDAIETSVFITETIGEDTIVDPLKMYAKAELLLYQNKFDKAISTLDSINYLFPKNNLEDDIWYLKANIFKKLKKYNLAIKMYNQVVEKFPDELRADNSIYELAELYEFQLNDINMAKILYKKLFIEYESSTLAIEARKKYREITEENVQ